jgi:hypothetical protein
MFIADKEIEQIFNLDSIIVRDKDKGNILGSKSIGYSLLNYKFDRQMFMVFLKLTLRIQKKALVVRDVI